MRLGKLTIALLISPVLLALVLLPGLIVAAIFGLRYSAWSLLVYGLLFVLLQRGFGWLAKRWPTVFGVAAVEGGPRLTIARVFILCSSVVLSAAIIVYLYFALSLTSVQIVLVCGVVFGSLLLVINLLEGRWRAADETGRDRAG